MIQVKPDFVNFPPKVYSKNHDNDFLFIAQKGFGFAPAILPFWDSSRESMSINNDEFFRSLTCSDLYPQIGSYASLTVARGENMVLWLLFTFET